MTCFGYARAARPAHRDQRRRRQVLRRHGAIGAESRIDEILRRQPRAREDALGR